MPKPSGSQALYAYITVADHQRICQMLGEYESVSEFVRACMNDYLESVGEPPLAPLKGPGRPPGKVGQRRNARVAKSVTAPAS